jgi:hypothetical protein
VIARSPVASILMAALASPRPAKALRSPASNAVGQGRQIAVARRGSPASHDFRRASWARGQQDGSNIPRHAARCALCVTTAHEPNPLAFKEMVAARFGG